MSGARGPERPGAERRWHLVRGGGGTAGRFAARARRRRLRALVPFLTAAGVLAVVVIGGWLVLGTRVFDVREVTVEGTATLSPAAVRAAAAVPVGSPLARVDVDGVRTRVARLAPVERVQVYRTWPHTLIVQVTERQGVAVVPRRGGYLVIDASGLGFRTEKRQVPGLPVIEVAKPGPGDRATRSALMVAASLTPGLRAQLVKITAPTAEQVSVVLARNRVVFWGDADDGARKATVATALLARPGTRIDVSAPDVVTVR